MNEKNVEVKINENDIVPAQVIKVNNKTITLKTEDNEIITVDRPKSTIKDKLFLKTMIDILRSGIWIPVNKKLKLPIQTSFKINTELRFCCLLLREVFLFN